jgi:hypothetical protein
VKQTWTSAERHPIIGLFSMLQSNGLEQGWNLGTGFIPDPKDFILTNNHVASVLKTLSIFHARHKSFTWRFKPFSSLDHQQYKCQVLSLVTCCNILFFLSKPYG